MNFACDKCQKRYSIADEKVRGRTVKIRCKHCQNIISVQGPAQLLEEEEATSMFSVGQVEALRAQDRALSAQDASRTSRMDSAGGVLVEGQWFAMVKGKQVGPFDARQLQAKVKTSEISVRTYLWKEGMGDWKRASDLPEMASLFLAGGPAPSLTATPAPPPPPAIAQMVAAAAPARETDVNGGVLELSPRPGVASSKGGAAPLAELFGDAPAEEPKKKGKKVNGNGAHADEEPGKAKPRAEPEPTEDPFAALGEIDPAKLPPAGEATSFFIAQAGVNKRNPPWKIAAFIGALLVVPTVTLYLLSELKVVPLKIKTVDGAGREVEQSVFSADGVSGLSDLLLGRNKKPPKPPPTTVARQPVEPTGSGDKGTLTAAAARAAKDAKTPGGPTAEDLASLYGDASKKDVGPKVRKGGEEKMKDTATGGLDPQVVAKVVGQNQPAFQSCIEQEMRKNPNFKGGKVNIVANVATSGVVTGAQIDRMDIDKSGLGECLKMRARRMVFSSFAGEETSVEIPLILSGTL